MSAQVLTNFTKKKSPVEKLFRPAQEIGMLKSEWAKIMELNSSNIVISKYQIPQRTVHPYPLDLLMIFENTEACRYKMLDILIALKFEPV